VAWIREIAASGAYWVSAAADHVVAHPLSMTGSIGVQASSFGLEEVLGTLKIDYRRMVAGRFKDMGTPFREPTEKETAYLREVIDRIHASFIRAFAEYRNIPEPRARELASGKIYLGETALEHGMVDQLGSRPEIMEWLRARVEEPVVLERLDGKRTFWDSLFQGVHEITRGFMLDPGDAFARFWTRRTPVARVSVSNT
jgi:protease-4